MMSSSEVPERPVDAGGDAPQADCERSAESAAAEASASRVTLEAMAESVARLEQVVGERLAYDEAKEQAFNRLYADLDAERKVSSGEMFKPILRDLVLLHDHVAEALRAVPDDANLNMVREGLLEVLYRADVEVLRAPDDKFDRAIQRATRTVDVEDAALDRTVAEVLKDGFTFRGMTLRPQEVVVRRCRGAAGGTPSEGQD